jgi:hypothetical protein
MLMLSSSLDSLGCIISSAYTDPRKYPELIISAIQKFWKEDYKNVISAALLQVISTKDSSKNDLLKIFLNKGHKTMKDDFKRYLTGQQQLWRSKVSLVNRPIQVICSSLKWPLVCSLSP